MHYPHVHTLIDVPLPAMSISQVDPEDFAEEQWLMGRLVQLFQPDQNDVQYTVCDHTHICHELHIFCQ